MSVTVVPLLRALQQELADARCQHRPVLRIRVTADAFAGAPVCAPIALPTFGAMPAGHVAYGRELELLVHPDDWDELGAAGQDAQLMFGLPVLQ